MMGGFSFPDTSYSSLVGSALGVEGVGGCRGAAVMLVVVM